MHVRDLNFVLRSEIFVHFDGQLRASHLILNCDLAYSTWKSFSQSLLVDSPLLLYIDVWHPNFLPLLATPEKGSAPPNNHPRSQVKLPREPHVLGCLAGFNPRAY